MLTEAQVAKARTFPGCNDISAENAVDELFASAETLQGELGMVSSANVTLAADLKKSGDELATLRAAVPQATPPSVLKAMSRAAQIQLKDAVAKQAITPAVSEALASSLIGTDEQLSAIGLTPDATGECVATKVFSALAGNGKAPNVGKEPEGQAAPKTANGAPELAKPITEERKKQLLAMSGLSVST